MTNILDHDWPILGIHGEHSLTVGGLCVTTHELGADPGHQHGHNYLGIATAGQLAVARLNHGYGSQGTIPSPDKYGPFSIRVGNWVRNSSEGCHIWAIGNEMNHGQEKPGNVDGKDGQDIMPWDYARCYGLCKDQIKSQPGHQDDIVLMGAVAPWNNQTSYGADNPLGEPNALGDWLVYYRHIQLACQMLGITIDGFDWHAYARGQTPDHITDPVQMSVPFKDHFWGFQVFRNWADWTLAENYGKPAIITEFNAYDPWLNVRAGFIPAASSEINAWNQDHPEFPIRGLACYRWKGDQWAFQDKPLVIADWMDAWQLGHTSGPSSTQKPPDPTIMDQLQAIIRDELAQARPQLTWPD